MGQLVPPTQGNWFLRGTHEMTTCILQFINPHLRIMASSVDVSVEAITEHQIREVRLDGQEIYVQ